MFIVDAGLLAVEEYTVYCWQKGSRDLWVIGCIHKVQNQRKRSLGLCMYSRDTLWTKGTNCSLWVGPDDSCYPKTPRDNGNMPLVYYCRFSAAVPVCMKQIKNKIKLCYVIRREASSQLCLFLFLFLFSCFQFELVLHRVLFFLVWGFLCCSLFFTKGSNQGHFCLAVLIPFCKRWLLCPRCGCRCAAMQQAKHRWRQELGFEVFTQGHFDSMIVITNL